MFKWKDDFVDPRVGLLVGGTEIGLTATVTDAVERMSRSSSRRLCRVMRGEMEE